MKAVTLTQARVILTQAMAAPRSGPERRVAIAVVDAGGHLLALEREEDAPALLAHIAQAKAQTCISYGKPTKTMMTLAEEFPTWFDGISRVSMDRMGLPLIATKGGVFMRDPAGNTVGAVGVAGEAGDYDEALAIAGILAAGFVPDAGE